MRHVDDVGLEEYLAAIAVTRIVLGPPMRIQAPPNLVDLAECRALLDAGVDDWGGVSPLTPDHVNPERPWPQIDELAELSAEAGFVLRERLTAHPPYLRRCRGSTRGCCRTSTRCADPDGLADERRDPAGPAVAGAGRRTGRTAGRIDLHTAIDTEGRRTETRSDFDAAYGDWDVLREEVAARPSQHRSALDADVRAALRAAERDPPGSVRRAGAGADDRRRARRWRRCARWPTTCAATRSATTSPTW